MPAAVSNDEKRQALARVLASRTFGRSDQLRLSPGQLVGVDNGNPIDTSSYKGTSRQAFRGKVLAIVRSTGTAGTITITASSSGLSSASVTVTA